MKHIATFLAIAALILSSCDFDNINLRSKLGSVNNIKSFGRYSCEVNTSSEMKIPEPDSDFYSFILSELDIITLGFEKGQHLDSLSIQMNFDDERIDSYNFYDLELIELDKSNNGCKVIIKSKNRSSVQGMTLNPGPAEDARPIDPAGINTGWVHRHGAKIGAVGIPIEINEFYHDQASGNFIIIMENMAETVSQINEVIESQGTNKDLILVLPVKNSNEYTEYKLRNPKIISCQNIDKYFSKLLLSSTNIIRLAGK